MSSSEPAPLPTTPRPGRPPRGRDRIFGVYVGDLNDLGCYVRRLLGHDDAFGRAHFDAKYEYLDPFEYNGTPYHELERSLAAYGLGNLRVKHLLDVGCGEGQMAAHLRDRVERVTLVDISPEAVRRARARLGDDGGQDLPGDALKVLRGLPTGAFDAIIISEILYFAAPNPVSAYGRALHDELVRVLAPGGRLVLMHPSASVVHLLYRVSPRFELARRVALKTFRSVEMLALTRKP
jgi:SAM-dependent methyltransferase